MSSAAPATRPRLVRIIDLVVAVVLALVGAVLGLALAAQYSQYGTLAEACSAVEPTGTTCSPGYLSVMITIGYGVVIFAWGLSAGMVVVRAIQKRLTWFWPLLGMLVSYAVFWIISIALSVGYVPPLGS